MQQQYIALMKGLQVRGGGGAARCRGQPGGRAAFPQQRAPPFTSLHLYASSKGGSPCAAQNIPIPLTGDDAAVKKYAAEVEALKKKVRARWARWERRAVLLAFMTGLWYGARQWRNGSCSLKQPAGPARPAPASAEQRWCNEVDS